MSSQRGRKRAKRNSDDEDSDHEAALDTAVKKKRTRRKKGENGDAEDMDSKAKRWESLSREQREKLVGDVMRLALFLDHKKHPIKRADITTKVLAEYKGSNLTSHLIAEAQKRFKDIFGYELAEVPRIRTDASADASKGGTGVYILKNIYRRDAKAVLTKGTNDQGLTHQTALLHTILAMITLSEGVIESELLYASLRRLGLDEDKPDPVLDDWQRLIDYFVKEMYIHRQKVPGRVSASGGPINEYRWGGRALLEVDKIEIMRHVAAMFGESLDPLIVQEMEKAEQQKSQKSSASTNSGEEGGEDSAAPASQPAPRRVYSRRPAH